LAKVDQNQKCKKDTQAKEKHKSQEALPEDWMCLVAGLIRRGGSVP
jgi:hypothetical protein